MNFLRIKIFLQALIIEINLFEGLNFSLKCLFFFLSCRNFNVLSRKFFNFMCLYVNFSSFSQLKWIHWFLSLFHISHCFIKTIFITSSLFVSISLLILIFLSFSRSLSKNKSEINDFKIILNAIFYWILYIFLLPPHLNISLIIVVHMYLSINLSNLW